VSARHVVMGATEFTIYSAELAPRFCSGKVIHHESFDVAIVIIRGANCTFNDYRYPSVCSKNVNSSVGQV
jgi:hypothetical protein